MIGIITFTTVASLAVTVIYALGSLLIGFYLGKKLPAVEKWILSWLVFDALTHFTLEGPFVTTSLFTTVNTSQHWTAAVWKEYGKADSRWLHSDPTIVSLEILTVVIDGTLCLWLIYAILARRFYRHYLQIVLCVCELYGGWMTFCPEWLSGNKSLKTDNVLYLWVYLFFFSMVWVVIPLALMWQTWIDIRENGIAPDYNSGSTQRSNKLRKTAHKGAGDDESVDALQNRYNLRSRKDL